MALTWRPHGSHVGGEADGPDLPPGRSDSGGRMRPARTGLGSSRPGAIAHDGATPAVTGGRPGGSYAVALREEKTGGRRRGCPHRRGPTGVEGDDGERRREMTERGQRAADGVRDNLRSKMGEVRGGERDHRRRGRRPKAATMAELTNARCGVGSSPGIRRRRGG
uniref:OSJNBb0115I09.15 protein n=1 Tax=Oryza sativa subsp. japonica TaxID=39947 RepID=Q7XL97_ORYSJ|nr:OSJNBb0115I09.15 [Oryza sativa Japonica Group]